MGLRGGWGGGGEEQDVKVAARWACSLPSACLCWQTPWKNQISIGLQGNLQILLSFLWSYNWPVPLLVQKFWMMGGLFDALLEGLPNTMEKVTFAVMILSQYCNFILPFPLTLGLTKVPALALSKQLCWPRFGLLHLVGYLITLISIPISKHTIPDLIRPVKSNQTYMVGVVV